MKITAVQHPTDRPNFYYYYVGNYVFWFSYQTCIAIEHFGEKWVRENEWSNTTGRHLNYIDEGNKEARLERDVFLAKLAEVEKLLEDATTPKVQEKNHVA